MEVVENCFSRITEVPENRFIKSVSKRPLESGDTVAIRIIPASPAVFSGNYPSPSLNVPGRKFALRD
jgi:hypothetical protein